MIYHVFANKSNVGDWLSALGIHQALPGHSIVECFCDEPFVDETLAALAQASVDDLVIIGGGGLFMDYFLPFWEGFSRVSDHLAYGIWGVGLCDLKREPSRPAVDVISSIVQKSQFCYVRDQVTHDFIGHCGLPDPIGCPSLMALTPTVRTGHGLLHVDNYTTAGADVYEHMDLLANQWALQTGRPLQRTNNRIEPRRAALYTTLDLYRKVDIVLSSALHGCIIGTLGRKVIAVSGDRKIDSFMQAAGLGDWVCDQTDVHRLPELFRRLAEQPPCEKILDCMRQKNFGVAQDVISQLLKLGSTSI